MKSYSEAKMIYEKLASASTEEHKPVYTLVRCSLCPGQVSHGS